MLRIRFTPAFAAAFLALMFLLIELHEVVHTGIGHVLCGGWGPRDFNVWSLREGCSSQAIYYLPTYAGPAFTFLAMWTGAWMLWRSHRPPLQSLGFCLIFANTPIGRMATAAMGGGDEVYATRHLLGSRPLGIAIGLSAVLLLSVPPLVVAWRSIANRHRWAWFTGFFAIPLLVDYILVFRGMNPLLARGVLQQPRLPYAPALITVWTAAMAAILLLLWPRLLQIDAAYQGTRPLRSK